MQFTGRLGGEAVDVGQYLHQQQQGVAAGHQIEADVPLGPNIGDEKAALAQKLSQVQQKLVPAIGGGGPQSGGVDRDLGGIDHPSFTSTSGYLKDWEARKSLCDRLEFSPQGHRDKITE